jgi:hypothetical protein
MATAVIKPDKTDRLLEVEKIRLRNKHSVENKTQIIQHVLQNPLIFLPTKYMK